MSKVVLVIGNLRGKKSAHGNEAWRLEYTFDRTHDRKASTGRGQNRELVEQAFDRRVALRPRCRRAPIA